MSVDAHVFSTATSGFRVPGTSSAIVPSATAHGGSTFQRDPQLRNRYLTEALADIPRLLGAIDRNPFRPTFGCLDRQYWHYRTACFPSEMYQEGVLPLALVYAVKMPGNPWHGNERVRELAVAGIRFAARSCHADGSCDDYYPFERALGAAVFSLHASARAYQTLKLDDTELLDWLRRRADWVADNDEPGRLANHQALAAIGLLRVAEITGQSRYRQAADARLQRTLRRQHDEGWFEEYGGADPGYQTVTIDCLAKYRRATGDHRLDEPLRRAVAFSRLFLHPDNSYAGEYGSRGTYHFYPHGMELLAGEDPAAADLADGFLAGLGADAHAHFDDDRMFAHRLANRIEAYLDWSPTRAGSSLKKGTDSEPLSPNLALNGSREVSVPLFQVASNDETPLPCPANSPRYLPAAQILVRRTPSQHTIVSAARGGVFKHFSGTKAAATDAGVIVETSDGRTAVSQWHEPSRRVEFPDDRPELDSDATVWSFQVQGPLYWTRFESATPLKQSVLHVGMWAAGRWCRDLVRKVLQRRLITGRRECPMRLARRFDFLPEATADASPTLRVTDTIELLAANLQVRRLAFGTDHQTAYVAACGVYQRAVLAPWTDLSDYVDELNSRRRVVVVREF